LPLLDAALTIARALEYFETLKLDAEQTQIAAPVLKEIRSRLLEMGGSVEQMIGDAMRALGQDPKKINPLAPVDLVIDRP